MGKTLFAKERDISMLIDTLKGEILKLKRDSKHQAAARVQRNFKTA